MSFISKDEFLNKIEKLKSENKLFKTLMTKSGGFYNLPIHLQDDALKKMGLEKHVAMDRYGIFYKEIKS